MADIKKTTAPTLEARLGSDPEMVQALIGAYGRLELAELLEAMVEATAGWSAADCGFGLGLGGDRGRVFVPLASTVRGDGPQARTLAGVEPALVKQLLGDGPRLLEGIGPFAPHGDWPEAAPGCCLAVPLLDPAERWGGLLVLVYASAPDAATIERVSAFAEMARPAVGNALQVLSMRDLVIKDDTASCFNRRHFEECMPEELSRASRFRASLSLIFLDLDNLKEVNNRHGHAMGSRTLYEVSVRVRGKIRKFDKLFRFGGDEFCIVLPETDAHGAKEVGERVRDAISGKPFLTRELRDGTGIRVTASLGIASFPLHARNQKDLIQLADRAMQTIKQGGKDGIGIAGAQGGEADE